MISFAVMGAKVLGLTSKVMPFLSNYWKYIAVAIALIVALTFVYYKGYNARDLIAQLDEVKAQVMADKVIYKAQKDIDKQADKEETQLKKIEANRDKKINSINDSFDDDRVRVKIKEPDS